MRRKEDSRARSRERRGDSVWSSTGSTPAGSRGKAVASETPSSSPESVPEGSRPFRHVQTSWKPGNTTQCGRLRYCNTPKVQHTVMHQDIEGAEQLSQIAQWHGGTVTGWLERSACNVKSTGLSLVRYSYCVGTLRKFFAHSCSAILLHLCRRGMQVHF